MYGGFMGKKVKPREEVSLGNIYTILRKDTKSWRSRQTKGRLGF